MTQIKNSIRTSYQNLTQSAIRYVKYSFLLLIILALFGIGFFINFKNEERFNSFAAQSCIVENHKEMSTKLAIIKAAEIIVRDGKNVHPDTATKYAKWIYASGEKHNVDPVLILSVMSVESNFIASAKSPTGPIGLLQVAYTWHKNKTSRAGLFDPKNNIDVGTRILAEYKGATDTKTLSKYYGGSAEKSNKYALKVISYKYRYEHEILTAMYSKPFKG